MKIDGTLCEMRPGLLGRYAERERPPPGRLTRHENTRAASIRLPDPTRLGTPTYDTLEITSRTYPSPANIPRSCALPLSVIHRQAQQRLIPTGLEPHEALAL